MINIRPAEIADISAIIAVRRQACLDTYINEARGVDAKFLEKMLDRRTPEQTVSLWRRILKNPAGRVWVAENGHDIVGFCSVRREEPRNCIGSLYVASEFRNQGIGTQLLDLAFEYLGNDRDIWLTAIEYNYRAQQLYARRDFVVTRPLADNAAATPTGSLYFDIEMVRKAGL